MTDRSLPMGGDTTDDLPRTLRREREAREREAREREMRAAGASLGAVDGGYVHPSTPAPVIYPDEAPPATVRRFDVPFLHMVVFFMKAAVAAVPAILLLGVLVVGATHVAKMVFPNIQALQVTLIVSGPAEPAKQPQAVPQPPKK